MATIATWNAQTKSSQFIFICASFQFARLIRIGSVHLLTEMKKQTEMVGNNHRIE